MSLKQCMAVVLVSMVIIHRFARVEAQTEGGGLDGRPHVNRFGGVSYERSDLLRYSSFTHGSCPILFDVPDDIKRRIRKRGRRGGVRVRCRRRGSRVPVPAVVCGNVRSLRNKIDELHGLVRWNYAYRESSLICLTETWLQQNKDPDSAFALDGYTLMRGDRTINSGKLTGGGVCIYVNNRWCTDITVYEQLCNENIEYLTLSLRPFYLPREFTKVFVTTVYIPPSADVNIAESFLYAVVCKLENDNPDAVKIITGDFNNCHFSKCIPHYQQFVNFPTRGDKLLDPFFCNLKHSYMAKKFKPLGISDHDMCLLTPVYKQLLKRSKPLEKVVYSWNKEVNETLIGCMESTDFDVLYDNNASIDDNVDVLNSYLQFCTDIIVPKKMVRSFPNNKPWVTKELKDLLNKKRRINTVNDKTQLKDVQKEIDKTIAVCKTRYKAKVENLFKSDTKSAWNGVRQLTGMKKNSANHGIHNAKDFCNDLNVFYARFDQFDFSSERIGICNFHQNRNDQRIVISKDEVLKSLQSIKTGKAVGPDRINGHILKLCKEPLTPILCKIFQQSLDNVRIPTLWKISELIPIPKKSPPTCKNDYRPVALTSIMMKCLEKIVKDILCEQVKHFTDRFQFAYTQNRCVEDATLSFIDYVLEHMDKSNTTDIKHFVKILFVDFSSAFNTIQPHIMMQKLNNMNVNSNLIRWINAFLTGRPQYVKFLNEKSDIIITNTGAPQGCVLSPVLFTLYTSDCRCHTGNCQLFKYADDTALVSQCTNDDVMYRAEVENFRLWCKENYLELNVKKTKEMVVDFSTLPVAQAPLYMNGELVEAVKEYKYLGTIIDSYFCFNKNVEALYKKVNSRMYFVRKLSNLKIDTKIMDLFYTAVIQSVISFSVTCWFGNCNSDSKLKLTKVIKNCIKLGVRNTSTLLEIYKKCMIQRYKVIQSDRNHPLNNKYQMLPSGRRLRSARCRTARYLKSFVPASIRIINDE